VYNTNWKDWEIACRHWVDSVSKISWQALTRQGLDAHFWNLLWTGEEATGIKKDMPILKTANFESVSNKDSRWLSSLSNPTATGNVVYNVKWWAKSPSCFAQWAPLPHHPISCAKVTESSRLQRPWAIINREKVLSECQEILSTWADQIELTESLVKFQAARSTEKTSDDKRSDDVISEERKRKSDVSPIWWMLLVLLREKLSSSFAGSFMCLMQRIRRGKCTAFKEGCRGKICD